MGHDIISRAANTVVTGNTLDDGVSGTTSYAIDLPNGGTATVADNTITQGAATENPTMIAFGAEGDLYPLSSLLVASNSFVNHRPSGSIGVYNQTSISVLLDGNTFTNVATRLVGPGVITNSPYEPPTASVPEAGALSSLGLGLFSLTALGRRRTGPLHPLAKTAQAAFVVLMPSHMQSWLNRRSFQWASSVPTIAKSRRAWLSEDSSPLR